MRYFVERAWELAKGYFRPRARGDFYYPEETVIYRYYDGKRVVSADPVALYKRLMEVWGDLVVDMKVAFIPQHKDSKACYESMIWRIRGVFNLPPKDKGGLNDTQSMELLDHFVDYCERVKKNSSQTATSAPATSAATDNSSANGQTTLPTSDSGSTANGPSTAPPTPSVTAQPPGSDSSNPA